MEPILLKDYIYIARNHYKLFAIIIFFCLIIAGIVTYIIPHSYTSNLEIYVRHKGTDSSSFYTYDGYYSTQASIEYSETVAGFIQTFSALDDAAAKVEKDQAYIDGNFSPSILSNDPDYLNEYKKHISVKIYAPQLVTVTVSDKSPIVSELWAKYIGDTVTEKLGELNQNGDSNFVIDVIHEPVTQTNTMILWLDLVIGGVVGIVTSFTIGFIIESYKK